MVELAIPVKNYTKVIDKNGKLVARIDEKTGKNLNIKMKKSTKNKVNRDEEVK